MLKSRIDRLVIATALLMSVGNPCFAELGQSRHDSPDGKVSVQLEPKKILFINSSDKKTISAIGLDSPSSFLLGLEWKSDSTKFLYTNQSGVHVVDVYSGKVQDFTGIQPDIRIVRWSADGKLLAALGSYPDSGPQPNTLKIWNAESGTEVATFSEPLNDRLDWSPDGKQIALVDGKYVVSLYRLATNSIGVKIQADRAGLPSLVWSPDSKYIGMGNIMTGELDVFDTTTGAFVRSHMFTNNQLVNLKWSTDGKTVEALKSFGNTWDSWNVPYTPGTNEIVKANRVAHTLGMKGYIPRNLQECFAQLDSEMSAKQVTDFAATSEDKLGSFHDEFGGWMKNNWRLGENSRLARYFNGLGVTNPDDMSTVIIASYWRQKNGKPIDIEEAILPYKKAAPSSAVPKQ
jgi:hypothetical protein